MGSYRDRFEITRDILLVASNNSNGSKKTHIMYGARLGHKVLNRYLGELLQAGLLEYDEKSGYWLTDKGERFLELYGNYDRSRRDLEEQIDDLENAKKSLRRIIRS